ncbi:MAG: hypothetical protein N2504_05855 [candidate division WOR-3 bacterium]|nr:hypothetical protein [candidate division WOR-3 bacterium]MCX7948095.1 hypothetical protein [candidate division WOR-3 bacterium]MDW8150827.1 hypothetical protein [candidate division WOR-3 bacterium]
MGHILTISLFLVFILLFFITLHFGPIILLPIGLAIIFILILSIQSKKVFFWIIALALAIRPITIDLFFWNTYVFGFKITHIYSFFLIALSIFAIFRLKVFIKNYNYWILPALFFIYHFFMGISILQGGKIFSSLEYFLRSAGGIPFFFLIGYLLEDEKELIKFLKIILIPLLVLVAFSVIFTFYRVEELYMITGNQKQFWRLKLLYHDSTQLVIYLTMALIILCYLYYKERKIYYLIFIYLTLIPIYATQTRSAWVSVAFIMVFFSFLLRSPIYLIPILIFGIFRYEDILKRWDYAGIEFAEEAGFSGRLSLWKIGLYIFLNSDIIKQVFGQVVGPPFLILDFHNQYIYWLVSNGIFGFLFNISILMILFIKTINPLISMIYMWIFISGFLANFLIMPNVVIFLWSILGYYLRKRENLSFP